MTLAIEDANSKLVDQVAVADVDVEESLVTTDSLDISLSQFSYSLQFLVKGWHLFWLPMYPNTS